jgi:hypothetical protein
MRGMLRADLLGLLSLREREDDLGLDPTAGTDRQARALGPSTDRGDVAGGLALALGRGRAVDGIRVGRVVRGHEVVGETTAALDLEAVGGTERAHLVGERLDRDLRGAGLAGLDLVLDTLDLALVSVDLGLVEGTADRVADRGGVGVVGGEREGDGVLRHGVCPFGTVV